MSWGEAVELPVDTDGGTIEHGEVSITFLGRIVADDPPAAAGAGLALDQLLTVTG